MITNLDYFVVDVFTKTPLAGNPLAVALNTCGLATDRMQAIAREFNLSETTFIERRPAVVERAEGVRVRIFTAREELPFAGHPTLGTASVLRTIAPEAFADDTVTLALNVGPVPVRFEPDAADSGAIFGEMTQRDPEFGAELNAAKVAPLLGLLREDLDPAFPPQVVSTGTPFAIVVLRSVAALQRLKVDQEKATPWLRERGARFFYVLSRDPTQSQCPTQWCARIQFYGGEDPATGSAAGCAISYLVARGAVPSRGARPRASGRRDRPPERSVSLRKKRFDEGLRMCAWRAAPFLWQKDSFSCRDAHAFNRNSSSQVAVRRALSVFHLFHTDFHPNLRLLFPLPQTSAPRTLPSRCRDFSGTLSKSRRRAKTLNIRPRKKADPQRNANRLPIAHASAPLGLRFARGAGAQRDPKPNRRSEFPAIGQSAATPIRVARGAGVVLP